MANLITIIRMIIAFIAICLLFFQTPACYITAFVLTIIAIWFDGLDGFVARLLKESSKLGAVLDILGDRVVENIYWIVFAVLGWIPVWVPLIVVTRGILPFAPALRKEKARPAAVTLSVPSVALSVPLITLKAAAS